MPADADRDEIEARKSAERIRKALARVEANLAQSGQEVPEKTLSLSGPSERPSGDKLRGDLVPTMRFRCPARAFLPTKAAHRLPLKSSCPRRRCVPDTTSAICGSAAGWLPIRRFQGRFTWPAVVASGRSVHWLPGSGSASARRTHGKSRAASLVGRSPPPLIEKLGAPSLRRPRRGKIDGLPKPTPQQIYRKPGRCKRHRHPRRPADRQRTTETGKRGVFTPPGRSLRDGARLPGSCRYARSGPDHRSRPGCHRDLASDSA